MTELELYYNKFNEEKRLNSRHGQVEFRVSMKYIHEMLEMLAQGKVCADNWQGDMPEAGCGENKIRAKADIKILDIGAGTGRYSVPLAEEGYDVTAVELVKHNLGILKSKGSSVKAYQGNALKLKRFANESFDLTLLFGPMYHLFSYEDKIQALKEAKRVTKPGGIIMVAYCMNEYGVLTYAFKERHILECVEENRLTEEFKTLSGVENLYDYMRIEEIDKLVEDVELTRIKLLSPDGPANYMRTFLNQLSEEEFEHFVRYQMATCERPDLIGAGAHTLDILRKP